jgi:proline iminopeptidase
LRVGPDSALYPGRAPDRIDGLDVGDGHRLFVAEFGPPDAAPALFLHGGPGSGCDPWQVRLFHPTRWRLILPDQRGAGDSTPGGALHGNDTAALVADLERLREHLGVTRWLVHGGSWGATLAIEYAKRHPARVQALVLRGVFLARAEDLEWFAGTGGIARQLPQAYAELHGALGLPPGAGLAGLLDALHVRLAEADPHIAFAAAQAWTAWEAAVMGMAPREVPPDTPAGRAQRERRIGRNRIHVHYCRAGFFLGPRGCLDGIEALSELQVTLVHGGADPVCRPEGARLLAGLLPNATLRLIPGAGHLAQDPALAPALRHALDAALPPD